MSQENTLDEVKKVATKLEGVTSKNVKDLVSCALEGGTKLTRVVRYIGATTLLRRGHVMVYRTKLSLLPVEDPVRNCYSLLWYVYVNVNRLLTVFQVYLLVIFNPALINLPPRCRGLLNLGLRLEISDNLNVVITAEVRRDYRVHYKTVEIGSRRSREIEVEISNDLNNETTIPLGETIAAM
ncbi:hypothetical protein L1887_31824 [Cichorium endivia]|nr:hypothetical protein L1887_31824 [Cichorium endivia]